MGVGTGQRWTQVQDIGPKARWLHAMAFDGVAGKVVLFGGLSAFVPTGDPALKDALLGDTWEHETQLPAPPPPDQGIVIVRLSLNPPMLAGPGEQSIATFTLSSPSTTSIEVFMAAFVDAGLTNPVSQQALSLPNSVTLDPGQISGQFQITRGNEPLNPGFYTIATGIAGSTQTALLEVSA
jgi:hypothetical protein